MKNSSMLLIIGFLFFVVYVYVARSSVSVCNPCDLEWNNINHILVNSKNWQRQNSKKDMVSLNNSSANVLGVFPIALNSGNYHPAAKITSSWGGDVILSVDNAVLLLVYENVPDQICKKLLPAISSQFKYVAIQKDKDIVVVQDTNILDGPRFNPSLIRDYCHENPSVIFKTFLN